MEQVSSNTAKMRRYRARLKERGLHRTPEVRAANNARMKAWNAKWRRTALEALGGKCKRCGFADERALQIDHVHGDGNQERRENRQGKYYRKVIEAISTGKYQLLCANCNWIKRHENGEHN